LDWDNLGLSRIDDHELDRPFTLEELKHIVDELPAEKAPGPDGFTGLFYKRCWDIIKMDVLSGGARISQLGIPRIKKIQCKCAIVIIKVQDLNIVA